MFCVKWLTRLSIFIILVLVSKFVLVVLLSECKVFCLSSDRGQPLLATVGTSLKLIYTYIYNYVCIYVATG